MLMEILAQGGRRVLIETPRCVAVVVCQGWRAAVALSRGAVQGVGRTLSSTHRQTPNASMGDCMAD